MNDPESFEAVKTTYSDLDSAGLIVRTTFRGKNAFGGKVTQTFISKVDTAGNVISLHELE